MADGDSGCLYGGCLTLIVIIAIPFTIGHNVFENVKARLNPDVRLVRSAWFDGPSLGLKNGQLFDNLKNDDYLVTYHTLGTTKDGDPNVHVVKVDAYFDEPESMTMTFTVNQKSKDVELTNIVFGGKREGLYNGRVDVLLQIYMGSCSKQQVESAMAGRLKLPGGCN